MAAPLVIDSARVLAYAVVKDIPYRKSGLLFVDGELLEHVPRLAICANLGKDLGILLFHCDEEWNVLGTNGGVSVEDVKARAERNYPGVAARWVHMDTTVEQALAYYDAQTGGEKCSFCGKRAFEVEGWIESPSAIVCRGCVEEFHGKFNDAP
ncbi:ClpX C4-type zinc finger protein [Acidovorax sp.]|uniref:ClpX C4-type zinc finger protein n=1 Tax=Acidovorax sp. TaxID=1872122 RepID=UPI00391EECF7